MRAIGIARVLLAVSAASLAIMSFTYGDLGPAGQSLPGWVPAKEIWIYGIALVVFAAGIGVCFSSTAHTSVLTVAVYLALWALLCVPQIFAKPLSLEGWYGFSEALTAFVGTWILYTLLRELSGQVPIASPLTLRMARVLFGMTCVFYGWSHFVYADYTASMVPTWVPARRGIAYFTGIGHVAAGMGIIFSLWPRLAASLEAIMMTLFGLLVWVPSFWMHPRPEWAGSVQNQWSELVVNTVLATSAWIVAFSLRQGSGRQDSVSSGASPLNA